MYNEPAIDDSVIVICRTLKSKQIRDGNKLKLNQVIQKHVYLTAKAPDPIVGR